jgi:large repetitive protein
MVLIAFASPIFAQMPKSDPEVHRLGREQQFLRGRMLPHQQTAELLRRAYAQKLALRAARPSGAPSSTSPWTSLGPAPLASDASGVGQQDYNWVSGRATAVAIDSSDATANTVYLGGAYGGVWKSTNAATQSPGSVFWTPLIDDQATLAVGAIAIQPGGTGVLVVGTGEANSSADSYYGLGILRSPDAGQSWTLISTDITGTRSFAGMAFSKIAFSTANPLLAVAATAGASEGIIEGLADPVTANLGLYTSADGGNTWTYSTIKDGNVTIDPGSATAVIYNAVAGLFFASLRYHGFYSSLDGLNWTRLANQPGSGLTTAACPPNPHSTACPIYRGELAVIPGRNEMYVWYVDANNNDQGIWTTLDGGATWTALNESGITNCGDVTGCGTEDGSYNLELAAVPDGGATDLYAGAVNIYKCQITSFYPTCNGPNNSQNTFLNLTHAYGCSSVALVHPAQHAVAFLLTNGNTQDVMYFANDGGLYRALDGYNLIDGSCDGHASPFDSLNQTLGSMTQLVSFSQSPADPNTVLAGAGANGSPATQSALSSSPWLNVNAGDGGSSQINPADPTEWFVSNPPDSTSGTNIFSCQDGINCLTQDFQNDQIVSSATVGGDTGAYYPSFLLDPQNSGELIVGTCRIWRGSSTGAGFTLLSNNFETGGSGTCTGAETNLVRSAAAGGPLDANNFSNVIYAGTDGFGPLVPTIPSGGHVWVSTDVAGGANTWVDQTGVINPDAFPISGIALDTSDPTGLTAYVGIMGFHVSHLWKTTNGGVSWTDFTANLPDAPADAVLVDPGSNPSNGMLYIGTDVGVFSSPTAAANWTEVGPAPNSGNPGFLPNVAVTALNMFNSGSAKLLRASTYGRGLWQFPLSPTFEPSVANTPQTVFTSQLPAQFAGSVLFYGYTDSVNLSCQPPAQATCSVEPTNVTPASPSFTITASAPVGSSAFKVKGVGTDVNQLTATAPFTLNVVDFALSAPAPNHITVPPDNTSQPVKFQVTASGPFNQTVSLSCAGLPSGASCIFSPQSANPTSASPVNVVLNITTAANTTAGTFPITISGSVTNGPTKTQNLSLTVTSDYSLTISNPLLTVHETNLATFNGALISLNGYSSPVNLSCGTGAPPTCTAAPATVTPTAAGAQFTVTVSSPTCGTYNFRILAVGTDSLVTSHSAPVTFISTPLVPPSFTLAINNSPLTADLGAPATFNGTLFATACYNYPVKLSCGSGSPPACVASPQNLVPTATGAPFAVAVSSNEAQTYNFDIVGQGADPSATVSSQLVSFTSASASGPTAAFNLSSNPTAESVTAGQPATFALTVAATKGKLQDAVALTLAGCPNFSTCTLTPAQVPAGDSSAVVSLTIQTSAPTLSLAKPASSRSPALYALWLSFPGLMFTLAVRRPRHRVGPWPLLLAIFTLLCCALSCGGGLQGSSIADPVLGTTPSTYLVSVSAVMTSAPGSPTQTIVVALTVN